MRHVFVDVTPLALAYSSTLNSTSLLAGAATALRNIQLMYICWFLLALQQLRHIFIRTPEIAWVTEQWQSYTEEAAFQSKLDAHTWVKIDMDRKSLLFAMGVGREDLQCGDSWNLRYTFGWATLGGR